jgi:hypothetical protein
MPHATIVFISRIRVIRSSLMGFAMTNGRNPHSYVRARTGTPTLLPAIRCLVAVVEEADARKRHRPVLAGGVHG